MFGNTTPHNIFVGLPTSSPLIKFANLPKKIPIGETHAIISNITKNLIFLFIEKKYTPIIIPIQPHDI